MKQPQSCRITNCIANVSGLCAAEKCYGAFTRLKDPRMPEDSFAVAAKKYQIAKDTFDDVFDEEDYDVN